MEHSIIMDESIANLGLPNATDILEACPGCVAVLNPATSRLLYCNKEFEQAFGCSRAALELSSFSFNDLIATSQLDRFSFQLQAARESYAAKNKYSIYQLKGKDGHYHPFYLYLSPFKSEKHNGLLHMLLLPDISEASLPFDSFDARELFLNQLDVSKFGSFEWMIDSQQVFWTDGLYGIYEIEYGTPVNRELVAEYTHPEDAKKGAVAVARAIEDAADIELEMKIITGKKNTKVLRVLGRAVRNDQGKVVKLVGNVHDITGERKIGQDMKRNVEELNRSNKELEEFAYVASHDLQEPLRKISTFSDRLFEKYSDVLSGEGAMYLERMMASAENMRLLINNLLEFSRVTRSTQPFSPVSLDFIVKQVKSELELVIEETGTVVESVPLPTIDASMTQMKQLFSNIFSNAIKFRKPDVKPVIKITSSVLEEDEKISYYLPPSRNYYKISICDNGIGFENEYAAKIFQIFQRLHGKTEYPGSGIGLAICKRIIEHHQGLIFADSSEGEGACFIFILPEKNQ